MQVDECSVEVRASNSELYWAVVEPKHNCTFLQLCLLATQHLPEGTVHMQIHATTGLDTLPADERDSSWWVGRDPESEIPWLVEKVLVDGVEVQDTSKFVGYTIEHIWDVCGPLQLIQVLG